MTSVQIHGDQADASVSITPKGSNAAQGMQMKYHLEQKDSKWVVVGRPDSSVHGAGTTAPGTVPNPHTGGKMPSPEDLPPATKKP